MVVPVRPPFAGGARKLQSYVREPLAVSRTFELFFTCPHLALLISLVGHGVGWCWPVYEWAVSSRSEIMVTPRAVTLRAKVEAWM